MGIWEYPVNIQWMREYVEMWIYTEYVLYDWVILSVSLVLI